MTKGMLEVEGLSHAFGGLKAVADCSFGLDAGRVGALIGPNGAGKSTIVNLVAGTLPLQRGRILFEGGDISRWPMYRIARRGLIRTFQLSRELGGLSVLENMLVPPPNQQGERLANVLFRPGVGRDEDRRHVSKALGVLETFGLYHLRDQYSRNLSGGEKRLLELARAVMAEPKLLILDEPMAGINPALMARLCEHILRLRDSGITFLLVEHNLHVVDQICDHVIVMASGRTLATGRMADLREHPEVIRVYLGTAQA